MNTPRTTILWSKRPLLNRITYYLYDRFCGEPYIPKGKTKLIVTIGNPKSLGWDGRTTHAMLHFYPEAPGVHQLLIEDVQIKNVS